MGENEKMTERVEEYQEQEKVSLGMAFMYFLVGTGAILSLWLFAGLLVVISRMGG